MKQIKMVEWFNKKKKMELYRMYKVQNVSHVGTVIEETEKAYKCEVLCMGLMAEKVFTIWIPKSCVVA